ncbi:actin-like ATPase domain-containing protein [Violaceomyces palustris]|uniref:Actin-like ATPase domain-containing protein n=1 Tax=Violaceomyces palustris TaxID=1673888 RepID=A0ACD0NLX8_9BASI|nr:actin-like ATPase domain-containing protein [Violaceomyces palustris]
MPSSLAANSANSSSSSFADIYILDSGASSLKIASSLAASHASSTSASSTSFPSSSSSSSIRLLDQVSSSPNAVAKTRGTSDKKTYIADQILTECRDHGGLHLRLPMERGYVTDWAAQKAIWDRTFASALLRNPTNSASSSSSTRINRTGKLLEGKALIITEPYFQFPELEEAMDTILFEEYGASAVWRVTPAQLVPFAPIFGMEGNPPECMLVLDCGYSYCHAVPIVKDKVQWNAVRRLNLGGKLLTNLLKETLSFRQWDMMDETWLTNVVKEKCCFIASSSGSKTFRSPKASLGEMRRQKPSEWSFSQLVELCKHEGGRSNPIRQEYALPDYSTDPSKDEEKYGFIKRGPGSEEAVLTTPSGAPSSLEDDDFIADLREFERRKGRKPDDEEEEQMLVMESERFQITEALFSPGLVGLDQCSVSELVYHSIQALPEEYRGLAWCNIVPIGGNVKIPGFIRRLRNELTAMAPDDIEVRIWDSEDPTKTAAQGALNLSLCPPMSSEGRFLRSNFVTRAEWESKGTSACRSKFGGWSGCSELLSLSATDKSNHLHPSSSTSAVGETMRMSEEASTGQEATVHASTGAVLGGAGYTALGTGQRPSEILRREEKGARERRALERMAR